MSKKQNQNNDPLIFVTGYSGAGLSSVLKNLEDFEYEAFDNFPLDLVEPLLSKEKGNVAIGIDTRTRGFSPEKLVALVNKHNAKLVFISCDPNILQRRFKETRRRHPMARDKAVKTGIQKEQDLLSGLQNEADLNIDTTKLSVHDLRHILEGHFSPHSEGKIITTVMSFGFRHGLPREADIVMDVRFLKNPHWEKNLRPLTGLDQKVGDFIEKDEDYEGFLDEFQTILKRLLPRYQKEGKYYLTVAIGCTGGRHRSVYTSRKIQEWLKAEGHEAALEHRDLEL